MNSVKNGKIEGMGMISIKKIVGALIVLFVIIVNLNKSYGIYEKEILFISSYSPEFISFKDQVKGIKDTLGDEFNLQVQYMNAKSFSDKVDESDFYNLLKYSIAKIKVSSKTLLLLKHYDNTHLVGAIMEIQEYEVIEVCKI